MGEILGEDEDGLAVHRAPSGDDGVAGGAPVLDAESAGLMPGERVHLLKRALVEEQLDALTRSELALVVLAVDRALVVGILRFFAKLPQSIDFAVGAHTAPR